MRYVCNSRGRALAISDQEADEAIAQGFVEIPVEEYQPGRYFPQYDKGPNKTIQSVQFTKVFPPQGKQDRTEFSTVRV